MVSDAVTSPPGESISRTTALTRSSSRACCKAERISSTMESPTVPGMLELIKPRSVIRATLLESPRCTTTSRKRGGISSHALPLTRRKAVAARRKLTKTLAQRATNRKMLRQPRLRFAMTAPKLAENLPRHKRFSLEGHALSCPKINGTRQRASLQCWPASCYLEGPMNHLPVSGSAAHRVRKSKAQKRGRGRGKSATARPNGERETAAVGTLTRTKSLLLAALRVWELKHRVGE